ncbi:MAG TPA: hypothetical protein VN794_07685 [Methylomirabilota bacterium]|nr:hypothetical protein [Methylomirabilota bacterium]
MGPILSYAMFGCPADATPIGTPPAPTGKVLTTPPASESDAQAAVDALLNQQLEAQKELNAAGVESSWVDRAASVVEDTADDLNPLKAGNTNWLLWGAVGLGVFALVAISGGSPRRYGR